MEIEVPNRQLENQEVWYQKIVLIANHETLIQSRYKSTFSVITPMRLGQPFKDRFAYDAACVHRRRSRFTPTFPSPNVCSSVISADRLFNSHKNKQVVLALAELRDKGFIVSEEGKTGGRPKTTWRLANGT